MAKKKTKNSKKSSRIILDDERKSRDKRAKTKPKKNPVKKTDRYDDIDFIDPQREVEKSRSYYDVSRPAPPKNQPRGKMKKKINSSNRKPPVSNKKVSTGNKNQDFLGKNVAGSGVYEYEFYDNKSRKKKKPTSSSHTTRRSLKIFTYAAIVGVVVVLGITLSLTVFF